MAVILIVEDEPFTRELAGICIDAWGHDTLFADSIEDALVHATEELKSLFVSGAHFLSKPYTPDQLQTGVAALLEA